jgi:N-methylhydantoinase A/oxoprolinase/acetone carboxylase beta subunit
MAYLLGVDTGGTYTDAVILNEATDAVLASAKALTSRPDLAVGLGAAINAALADAALKGKAGALRWYSSGLTPPNWVAVA